MGNRCLVCRHTFSTPSNLRKHIRNIHKINIPKKNPGPTPLFTKDELKNRRWDTAMDFYIKHHNEINHRLKFKRASQKSMKSWISGLSNAHAEWKFCEKLRQIEDIIKDWDVLESIKWEVRNYLYPNIKVI